MTNTVLTQVQNNNSNGNNESKRRIPSSQKYKMKITNVKRCDMNTNIWTKTMQMVNDDLKFLSQIHISDADLTKADFFNLLLYSHLRAFSAGSTCVSKCTLILSSLKGQYGKYGHYPLAIGQYGQISFKMVEQWRTWVVAGPLELVPLQNRAAVEQLLEASLHLIVIVCLGKTYLH